MNVSISVCALACSRMLALGLAVACSNAMAQDSAPGNLLQSLLTYARLHNPEFAAMRHEAEAVSQRVEPAGALPDPLLRIELENINNYSVGMNGTTSDTPASILPARVGETKYNLIQALPIWGKRDLKREPMPSRQIAQLPKPGTGWQPGSRLLTRSTTSRPATLR